MGFHQYCSREPWNTWHCHVCLSARHALNAEVLQLMKCTCDMPVDAAVSERGEAHLLVLARDSSNGTSRKVRPIILPLTKDAEQTGTSSADFVRGRRRTLGLPLSRNQYRCPAAIRDLMMRSADLFASAGVSAHLSLVSSISAILLAVGGSQLKALKAGQRGPAARFLEKEQE